MTPSQKVEAINRNQIGTNVVYWPTLHRSGKRTRTRSAAFISESGSPVIFLENISGYVHIDHVEIGSLMPTDSPCFDENFQHLWGHQTQTVRGSTAMNTHDIELPPLPPLHIAPSVEPVDYPKVAQALMDYARAAIEADRKRRAPPNEPFAIVIDRMYEGEGPSLAYWNGENYQFSDGDCYNREGDTLDGYTAEFLTDHQLEKRLFDDRQRRGEPWMPIESCPGGNGVRYLFVRDCGQGTLPAVEMGYMLDADTEVYMDSTHEPFTKYGYRVTHWMHLPGLPNTPQPAEPVEYWLCCGSTDLTHADREQPDCYDPDKAKFGTAESHKDSPAEPVKRKRRYAQGTALGEFGVIPMCDQVDDEPDEERLAMEAVMESVDPATWPGLTPAQRCALGRFAKPQPAEPQECGCCGRSDGCDPDCDAAQPAEPCVSSVSDKTACESASGDCDSQPAEPVKHDLYKTGDEGAPEKILDRNGEVVLDCCKRCGKAEIELSEQCVAEPVSTHHVHRREESMPCYCAGKQDHPIGHEVTEPVKVPSDGDIMVEWANTPNTGDMRVDLVVFARAVLARYGQQAQPAAIPVGIAAPAGPMYPPGKTLALFDGSQVPPGERLYTAPIDPANDNPTPEEEAEWQRLEKKNG